MYSAVRAVLIGLAIGVGAASIMLVVDRFSSHATQAELADVERRTFKATTDNRARFEAHTDTANLEWRKQAAFRGAVINRLDLNVSATSTLVDDLPVAVVRSDEEVTPQ